MPSVLHTFWRNRSGVAAIEFALLTPLTIFMMLAEFDLYRYVMATQRIEIAAESIAQMVASAPANSNAATPGDAVIYDADLNFYANAEYFLYPDVFASPAVQQGTPLYVALEVDTTAIKMVKQSNGSYLPKTAWYSGSSNVRPCNTTYNTVADASTPTPTTLPQDVIGPNSLIVVDVRTTFQPTFGAAFLPSVPIVRSVYMTPRNVPFVELSAVWMGTNCP